MKKLLIVLVLIGGLIAVGSTVTRAGVVGGPALSVSQNFGFPGFEFTATVTDCDVDEGIGETVTLSVEGDATPTEVVTECAGDPASASADFTAPTTEGMYTVLAVLGDHEDNGVPPLCDGTPSRPCSLSGSIFVQPPPPTLTVVPETGPPGFDFTMTVVDCDNLGDFFLVDVEQERILIEVDVDFFTFTGTTIDPGATDDEDLGVPCDFSETPAEAVSKTFTAPDTPGVYPVLAIVNVTEDFNGLPLELTENGLPTPCDEVPMLLGEPTTAEADFQCSLTGEITVEAVEETTTTTTTTTTEPPEETTTTTAAPTTTIDEGAGVPAPTEPPAVELPATGTGGNGGLSALAILLLLAGGGLVVLGTRRRSGHEQR